MNIFAALLGSVFELYIGHMFFSKFSIKRVASKTYIFCSLILCIVLTLASITLVQSPFLFLTFSICIFLFGLLFNLKLTKRVLLTFALVITIALSEMIVAMTTTLGMETTLTELQNSNILYTICVITSQFLSFAILKPIKKKAYDSHQKFPLWFKIGTTMLPLTSVFIIILLYRYTYIVADTSYQISTLIAAILLIVANLLILFVIDNQETYLKTTERLIFAEAHIKNQLSHYYELYTQQETLKKFRHDSKNFYTSLISMLETLSTQDAINYIKERIEIDMFNNNVINSGHPVIDAIIYSKNLTAQKHGVSINSNIKITTKILIDELELGVLIGNALDNAIEAVSKLDESETKIIELSILTSGEMLSIEVSNRTNDNINTLNLTTNKKDKFMHGYGINSIKTITTKYNGNLSISCQNKTFILSTILVNN